MVNVCSLDGSPYGRLWDGSSPRPQTRITHLTRCNVDHFVFHKVLGKGSFGKVNSNCDCDSVQKTTPSSETM